MENMHEIEMISDALIYKSFYAFVRKSFAVVDPATDLISNWHIDFLSEVMEEVSKKKIKRLIVNIPPRNLKSIIISVAFPAWILGHNPSERVVVASYVNDLSIKHSTDTRKIMSSNWYQRIFKDSIISRKENHKTKFCTIKKGYRLATSVGGSITGEGGNFLIIDDPHNPTKIHSKKEREKVINWFESAFSTRLNDKKNGSIIIVMQRLHHEDLSGYLLNKQNNLWLHIKIPAISEKREIITFNNVLFKVREEGEFINPERESNIEIENAKKDLGTYAFNAQYQQNPLIDIKNSFIKKEWFDFFESNENYLFEKQYISIDCASAIATDNDFTAIIIICIRDKKFYIKDIQCIKLEYYELKKFIYDICIKENPIAVIIEDKTIGISLIQDLKSKNINTISFKTHKDKITRLIEIINIIQAKNIFLPRNKDFVNHFLEEITSFPFAKHDDQVDALTQFLIWYKEVFFAVENQIKIRSF